MPEDNTEETLNALVGIMNLVKKYSQMVDSYFQQDRVLQNAYQQVCHNYQSYIQRKQIYKALNG